MATQYNQWEGGATAQSIEGRLLEARQRKQAAVDARQARLEAEEREKQEIARYDAAIKALERQQAQQRFEQGKQEAEAIRAQNEADAKVLTAALDEVLAFAEQKLLPLVQAVDQTFLSQTAVRTQAVGSYQEVILGEIADQHLPDEVKLKSVEFQERLDAIAKAVLSAFPAWIWVTLWQTNAPENSDLARRRAGLYALLFGSLPADVTSKYDWQKDINGSLMDRSRKPASIVKSVHGPVNRMFLKG